MMDLEATNLAHEGSLFLIQTVALLLELEGILFLALPVCSLEI